MLLLPVSYTHLDVYKRQHWMLLKYSDTFAGQSPHMSAADTLAVFYDLIQEMQSNGSAVQKSWAEDLKRLAAGIY